ncbi:hypothetical protein ACNKHP_04245 [Shigella boydii]
MGNAGNDGYLQLVGYHEKFIDQSISAEHQLRYSSRFLLGKSADAAVAERPPTAKKFGSRPYYKYL